MVHYTKYETARLIGARALQIAMGAPFMLKLEQADLEKIGYNPIEIAKKEGVQFAHMAFRSGPESQTALLGGHIVTAVGDFPPALLEAGKIRVLLLISDDQPAAYPTIPILKALGYDMSFPTMINVVGPKGMPEGIVRKLEDAFTKAMKEPGFIKGMKDLNLPVVYRDGKELTEYVAKNYEAYGKYLRDMGVLK